MVRNNLKLVQIFLMKINQLHSAKYRSPELSFKYRFCKFKSKEEIEARVKKKTRASNQRRTPTPAWENVYFKVELIKKVRRLLLITAIP
jgi:hypothetical protein